MADFTAFPISTKEFDPAQFAGADGTDGTNGREVELQTNATHVQWRYVGEATWNDLILLSELEGPQGPTGPAGADGTDGIQPSGSTIVNIRETKQSVTTGAFDVALGQIITMTLSGAVTITPSNFDDGMSVKLKIVNGDTHAVNWNGAVWHGAVPTLGATHTVVLEKDGATTYGYDAQAVV